MSNVVNRIYRSAPLWAWIVMAVCVVVLVVGLIISSNRTAPTSSSSNAAMTSAPAAAPATPATVSFIDDAKANPSTPKTLVLLGDGSGSAKDGWAPALGTAISQNLDRPVATKFWNPTTGSYGAMVGLGDGKNGPVGYWNASAAGKDVAYTQQHLDTMIATDVTPDLILLNFGHTEDANKPLATQVQPLIDQLKQKYPNADIAVIKQNPTPGAASSDQMAGYAAAMDAEGVQVIDVYSAFPTDAAGLSAVAGTDGNPTAAGQKLWTRTILAAFGLPTGQ
ncbi:SGNH/GDSL hydrolase family protein [Gordonia sp. NPDC003424]